ncbi:TraB/GumN family protein [Roseivivax sediminis]|uniref:TraB family protein n=1 Tax=Roseivivax sediminis TaxID=936889 RepID=A0A1I1W1H7_9RHOB|nr:TraB/GumN family protein [Roseivivax sediminis]SFD88965.1 hypothetical protein SAMN04515678_10475 [Roseivivax sediminis]
MRLAALVAICLGLAQPALADCDGTDLRGTFTAAEREDLDRALDGRPYAEGNHWIARRGEEVVHLVGTVHLSDPRLDGPLDTLRPVIESSRLLLLEATPDGLAELQERLRTDPGLIVLQDASLPELMPEAAWQRLADAASARGIPPVMAAKFQPWYLTLMVSVPPCATGQLADANGLDTRLQTIAEDAGTPMAALEEVEAVFSIFRDAPLEDQVEMLRAALIDPGTGDDIFATLLAAYFEEKPAQSWEVTRILARRDAPDGSHLDTMFRDMEAALLLQRNRDWLPVILDATGPEPIVVAAGAAHLQGTGGLADLLEGEGFTLTRGPF